MIPVLQWIETWNHVLRGCLPGGHIMANCGSSCAREAEGQDVQEMMDHRLQWRRHLWQGLQEKVGGTENGDFETYGIGTGSGRESQTDSMLNCMHQLPNLKMPDCWDCWKKHGVEKETRGAFGFWCYKHNMVLKKRQEELLVFGATNTTWC
ncbi:hypothetical protein BDL97_18G044100 [Sphagnum fallax]|nr:hypothetical protein BDL97_18G044100 [Sphagnum fallax]